MRSRAQVRPNKGMNLTRSAPGNESRGPRRLAPVFCGPVRDERYRTSAPRNG
jgi:hypothetical protein